MALRDYNKTVAASGFDKIQTSGRFLWLKEANAALHIALYTETGAEILSMSLNEGDKVNVDDRFDRVHITNKGVVDIDAVIVCGEGEASHANVRVNASVTGDVEVLSGSVLGGGNDVSIAAGGVSVLSAADADKKEVIISVVSGSVRVGSAPAANNGILLGAGRGIVLNTSAEVGAYAVAASVVSVVEVKA